MKTGQIAGGPGPTLSPPAARGRHALRIYLHKKQFSKYFRGPTSYLKGFLKVFCSSSLPEIKYV